MESLCLAQHDTAGAETEADCAPEALWAPAQGAVPARAGDTLSEWVTTVYAGASPAVQGCLLEHLMRPLGVLALLPVASGVFAEVRLRSGRPDAPIDLEYLQEVRATDVTALVKHVQQRSDDALAGLIQLLNSVPRA